MEWKCKSAIISIGLIGMCSTRMKKKFLKTEPYEDGIDILYRMIYWS